MRTFIWLKFCTVIALLKCDELSLHEGLTITTDVAKERDQRLLVFSTLDGHLYGIEQHTGEIRWKIKDNAVVRGPRESSEAFMPLFLPNPQDGSLYLIGGGKELLKKLPFTIPELVTSSPCRSTDGILYTGKKKDTWFTIDPITGFRQKVLSWDLPNGPTCPIPNNEAVYVGRTEYSIMMVDSKQISKRWNVSFYEYTAMPISKESLANYDLAHFTSSSTGLVITMDRRSATIIWDANLGSPVVSAYLLDSEGLISIPFTSLSNNTLNNFAMNLLSNEASSSGQKLYPTLYIGEHEDGLYALPSYIDQNIITLISPDKRPLLLAGPDGSHMPDNYMEYPVPGQNYYLPDQTHSTLGFQSIPNIWNLVQFGHYDLPDYSKIKLQITGNTRLFNKLITDESGRNFEERPSKGVQTDDAPAVAYENVTFFLPNVKYFIAFSTSIIVAALLYKVSLHHFKPVTEKGTTRVVSIGKIKFKPSELLGKGCDGTFVYRGEFDGRHVAVKRLLPDSFNFADREVSLLRESDAHPNVVRYFCTEQDNLFRYIALELCQSTLSEYVDGEYLRDAIAPLDILRQATMGLDHLHSLNIVHRDIKPQNVLLSTPGPDGCIRAMISDFGLCKKLQIGRNSFSRRSGVAGTDGWIAPEMLVENKSTTCAVDMFSLGCLFYYVLSEGEHPFGDVFRRQANISSGEWSLDGFKDPPWKVELYKPLIKCLISSHPKKRPSCKNVLGYPIFWTTNTILSFLQDVSDRIEISTCDDPALIAMESNGRVVVRGNWRNQIDNAVSDDLKRYRSYQGNSIRDLLRALRNKKHHFRELDKESQEALGAIPDEFTMYWTTRFPLLLIHSWLSMQTISTEENFKQYYTKNSFVFPCDLLEYTSHEKYIDDTVTVEPEPETVPYKTYKKKKVSAGLYRNFKSDSKVQNGVERKPRPNTRSKENEVPPMWVLPQE